MSEQLDMTTFTGAHPTARDFVAQLRVWGFTQRRPGSRTGGRTDTQRRTDGVHLSFRAPRGGTVRVLRSLMGRADAGLVEKAARLVGVDVAQFWAGPDTRNDTADDDGQAVVATAGVVAELGPRRTSASRDRITALVLGVHTTADRPLGFDQVVALCPGNVGPDRITRDQVSHACAVLCRDGQLERIRSGVYQWADGVRARRRAGAVAGDVAARLAPAAAPARPDHAAPTVVAAAPMTAPARPSAAELFEHLFPRGVRMTAPLLAEFERWAELTEKLAASGDAY